MIWGLSYQIRSSWLSSTAVCSLHTHPDFESYVDPKPSGAWIGGDKIRNSITLAWRTLNYWYGSEPMFNFRWQSLYIQTNTVRDRLQMKQRGHAENTLSRSRGWRCRQNIDILRSDWEEPRCLRKQLAQRGLLNRLVDTSRMEAE